MALSPGQIVSTLQKAGLTKTAAAGVAGNAMQESSDNPGDAGGGLLQWQGDRYAGLTKYAQSRGLSATSGEAALGYLVQDLNGQYRGLKGQLNGAKSAAEAATLFSQIYERPGIPMLSNRIRYANDALGAAGGPLPGLPKSSGTTGATSRLGTAPVSTLTTTTPGRTVSKTTNVFDSQGFNAAKINSIAGQYVAGSSKDPYSVGQAKTGLSTAARSSPLLTSGVLSTATPNPADYQKAQTTLEHIAGTTTQTTTTSPTGRPTVLHQHPATFQANLKGSGYTNPLPGATWERTDMGVDASLPNGAPIKALGDSRVVHTYPGWYKGQPYILFQLLNGPQKGKYYYVAEAINSHVHDGQTVRAGQTIGTYNSGGTGLELGWGTPNSEATLAQASGNTGDASHGNAPAGVAFRNFLNGIGAHAG